MSACCHTPRITGDEDLVTVQLRATTLSLNDKIDHQHFYIHKIKIFFSLLVTTGLSVLLSWIDFFSIWVFFHNHLRITELQGKGKGISLTSHYHFHPLHRHLDINRAITAESSHLHIGSSRTRTGNLWFPSANR